MTTPTPSPEGEETTTTAWPRFSLVFRGFDGSQYNVGADELDFARMPRLDRAIVREQCQFALQQLAATTPSSEREGEQ